MTRIGLTGSIASGKSTVTARLRALGAFVIDADEISHEVTAAGLPALASIAAAFGADVLRADGSLDRAALGDIVFSDPARLKTLNGILHPLIRARMREMERESGEPCVVYDVPLLMETGMDRDMDAVWMVDAPEDVRMARLMRRNGLTQAQAIARLRAQLCDEEKRRRADVIIRNDGTLGELYGKVDDLWQSLNA
ncbi:MAG: dephospho-CoA kinase [Clostridia bacterium]|nr:dephospho-CoA kinase [Clostridia bacterium]